MKNWNETFRSLNVGLPDDVERLKAAGYYQEAIERIDAYLAEGRAAGRLSQPSPIFPRLELAPAADEEA